MNAYVCITYELERQFEKQNKVTNTKYEPDGRRSEDFWSKSHQVKLLYVRTVKENLNITNVESSKHLILYVSILI